MRLAAAALIASAALLSLEACALPRSAPLLSEVTAADRQQHIVLSPVTPEAVAATRGSAGASFPTAFQAAPIVNFERFAPGDGVDVVIWERDELGLFASAPSSSLTGGGGASPVNTGGATASSSGAQTGAATSTISSGGASASGVTGGSGGGEGGSVTDASDLGTFTVGTDGAVQIPYVGEVHIVGLTPGEARTVLLRRLRGLVIATDVRLTPTAQRGDLVTIQGDVTKAGVYPIERGLQRLSGLLSLAAPDQTNPDQTVVTVRRAGLSAGVRLADIYRDARQDIALQPNDSIVVSVVQDYVTVVGAAGGQGRVRIARRNYSVLDALADSRGMSDSVADPRGLYLVRPLSSLGGEVLDAPPRVYQFDMRRPDQVLLANRFAVRDGDVVLVSDAPFTQVEKALSALTATLGTARSVSGLSQ